MKYIIEEPDPIKFIRRVCAVASLGGTRDPKTPLVMYGGALTVTMDVPEGFEEPEVISVSTKNKAKAVVTASDSTKLIDKLVHLAGERGGHFTGELMPGLVGAVMVFTESIDNQPDVNVMVGTFDSNGKYLGGVDVEEGEQETNEENSTEVGEEGFEKSSEDETEEVDAVPFKIYTLQELQSMKGPELKELCDKYGISRRKSKINCIKDIMRYYEQFK